MLEVLTILALVIVAAWFVIKYIKQKNETAQTVAPAPEITVEQKETFADIWSEIEWRKDGYKRMFSKGDVVTFYETDADKHIWKGYMIVDSFLMQNFRISVIALLMYTSKKEEILSKEKAAHYTLSLLHKDMYYDSTRQEIEIFIDKLKELGPGYEKYISMLEQKRDSIIGDGIWWMADSPTQRYLDGE